MAVDINAAMDGLAAALATITDLRVVAYPAEQVNVPAAVVSFPEVVTFDATYGRGADTARVPVYVMVSSVSDRAARDVLNGYMVDVKAAVDGSLGGAVKDARVAEARPQPIDVNGVTYWGAVFIVEVVA